MNIYGETDIEKTGAFDLKYWLDGDERTAIVMADLMDDLGIYDEPDALALDDGDGGRPWRSS